MVPDHVRFVEWDAPSRRDLPDQRGAGRELRFGPHVIRASFVFDSDRVKVRIDSRLQQRPCGIDYDPRVKCGVILIHELVDTPGPGNRVMCRLLRRRIAKNRFSSSKTTVDDVNDDGLGSQPEWTPTVKIRIWTAYPSEHDCLLAHRCQITTLSMQPCRLWRSIR